MGYPACALPLAVPVSSGTFNHFAPGAPDVAFLADGGLLVSHVPFGGTVLLVSELVGSAWQVVGNAQVNDAGVLVNGAVPALVVTPAGPLIAFGEGAPASAVATRRFTGGGWQVVPFPAASNLSTMPNVLDLVVDSQGRALAVVATNGFLQAYRLETGGWAPLGSSFRPSVMSPGPVQEVRAAIRPDDTLVVFALMTLPPFGTGAFVAEQTTTGTWTQLGPFVDSIGSTTETLSADDLDVTSTQTLVTWTRGTCPMPSRFLATFAGGMWMALNEMNARGADPRSIMVGSDVVQLSRPQCSTNQLSLQRRRGSTWDAALPVPMSIQSEAAPLFSFGGAFYFSYSSPGAGNVARLNLP